METLSTLSLPDPPATDDNAATADHWHNVVVSCGRMTLEAAARCGDALCEQRDLCKQDGTGFKQWCAERLSFSYSHASRYMKIAENWDRLESKRRVLPNGREEMSIREALRVLKDSGEPEPVARVQPTKVQKARKLIDRMNGEDLKAVSSVFTRRLKTELATGMQSAADQVERMGRLSSLLSEVGVTVADQVTEHIDAIAEKHPDIAARLLDGLDPPQMPAQVDADPLAGIVTAGWSEQLCPAASRRLKGLGVNEKLLDFDNRTDTNGAVMLLASMATTKTVAEKILREYRAEIRDASPPTYDDGETMLDHPDLIDSASRAGITPMQLGHAIACLSRYGWEIITREEAEALNTERPHGRIRRASA